MPNETSPSAPVLTRRQTFFRRLSSFVVLWTIILTALFSGHKLLSDCVFLIVMVLLAKWILENNPHARVAIITDRDE